MTNTIHYSKALVTGTIEEFEGMISEVERRYPNDDNPMVVGLMMCIGVAIALRDDLGEELFYRNLEDIPDTKEAVIALLDEISAKLNDSGIHVTFDDFKKDLLEAAE